MEAVADRPFVVNDPRLSFDSESHRYQLGDRVLPSVTGILTDTGIADFSAPWFGPDILARGRYVHEAIALDAEGALDEATLDPQLVPYVAGWRAFLGETGAEIEYWEHRVCDPLLGYAGTIDGILSLPGTRRRVLVDVKRALYPSAGPQTAAYKRLALALYPVAVAMDRAVVELPGDGRYRFHPLTDRDDERVFLAALCVTNWRRTHGDRD